MAQILEGKIVREETVERLKQEILGFSSKPTLTIIQIGDNDESGVYIRQKQIFGEKIGAEVRHIKFNADESQEQIISEIKNLNIDKSVHGIIVQLPLPENFDENKITEAIIPSKDVDGLTSSTDFMPATARGILSLLDFYKIDPSGKNAVVMGRSKLVGKPTAEALLNRGARVNVAHSQTENIREVTKQAEILIVAVGKPKLVDASYVRAGQVIIDVGINVSRDDEGKKILSGDVNFDEVKDIVSAISPVPGGVGLMTVCALFENLIKAYKMKE